MFLFSPFVQNSTRAHLKYGVIPLGGQTALHVAVLSHNAVENEWRRLAHTRTLDQHQCQYQQRELLQRKHIYVQCVKALLHMGASCGTKVHKYTYLSHKHERTLHLTSGGKIANLSSFTEGWTHFCCQ